MTYGISERQLIAFDKIFDDVYDKMQDVCGGVPFEDFAVEDRALLLILSCGISHNMNWDFLCGTLIPRLVNETKGQVFNLQATISPKMVLKCCSGYEKTEKYDEERRSKMLNSMLEDLEVNGGAAFIKSILASETVHKCVEKLKKIRVFAEDPVRKKLYLLLQLLLRTELIKVSDEHKMEAAVDYHIIRVYLRTGRIKVLDEALRKRLLMGREFSLDELTELRQKINEVMQFYCKKFNRAMAKLCFIDWALGRTYCGHYRPDCVSEAKNQKCPYAFCCESFNVSHEELYKEPISDHGFY